MKTLRWTIPAVLATVLLLIPACVELTGQRITWFHDAAADTLHFLIHYDGVHDTKANRKGSEQIPEFVDNGDVMLADWPFHLDREAIGRNARSQSPVDRGAAQLISSIETTNLGHYREPDGRIGAAQLVSIPQATEFVAQLNDLISHALLSKPRRPTELPRTMERIRDAAGAGHEWIALRGHSIRATLPVHPGEWSQAKASVLREMFDEAIKQHLREPRTSSASLAKSLTLMLGSAPISYIDEGDRVTFVLGRPDQPTTLRAFLRDGYQPNLEEVVTVAVPQDLDEALARVLLDADRELPEQLAPLLAWGPRENQVRALLAAASGMGAAERRVVAERLARWGARWNRDQGVPEAPLELDPDEFTAHWADWYQQVVNLGR